MSNLPTYTVVLGLTALVRGEMCEYATIEQAQAAVDRFGHAVEVRREDDARGSRLLVTCAQQRGDAGAFRLHSIACVLGVPVHVA